MKFKIIAIINTTEDIIAVVTIAGCISQCFTAIAIKAHKPTIPAPPDLSLL